jgi:hypothetical protein
LNEIAEFVMIINLINYDLFNKWWVEKL